MRRRQRRVVVRFSDNGPLTFSRQLDVVADAANLLEHALQGLVFRKCGEKSETSEHNRIFANKTAGHGSAKRGSGRPISVFTPHFWTHCTEVCGKFWDPRAHRPFRAEKPQVEALRGSRVLGKF